jgi:primosomal replication protein N
VDGIRRQVNQLQCVAKIVERDVLRYTPAGIPIVSARLRHQSEQTEAGMPRQVEFEISVIAAGEISGSFSQASLDSDYLFTGFLARRNRNSKSLVFHLTAFEAAQDNPLRQEPHHGIR